ncbi:hypothetical protein OROMI_030653 [Orobanche minor]
MLFPYEGKMQEEIEGLGTIPKTSSFFVVESPNLRGSLGMCSNMGFYVLHRKFLCGSTAQVYDGGNDGLLW